MCAWLKEQLYVCVSIRLYIRSLLFSLFFWLCGGRGISPSFYRMPKYLVTDEDIEAELRLLCYSDDESVGEFLSLNMTLLKKLNMMLLLI